MEIELIVFDLDDTLIDTQPLYLDKIHRLGLKMVSLGFDYYETIRLELEIDKQSIEKEGVARHRFPESLVNTYRILCEKKEIEPCVSVIEYLRALGYSTYAEDADVFPTSEPILLRLSEKYKMCILTKGEKDIQFGRLLDSGLIKYFDHSFVVMDKTPEMFRLICDFFGTTPQNTMMIGNSLPSDILPALDAGLYGIHLERGTFNYERTLQFDPGDYENYRSIGLLSEIFGLLGEE